MSGVKPARRWQPPYYPFKREKLSRRMLAGTERLIKGSLFGCRMCGNCLLQETAFICPMECPKGMRNGPCGGITPEKNCYIDISRKCIWNAIYLRARKTGRMEKLLEILPPLDWSMAGAETWGGVVREIKKAGTAKFISGIFSKDKIIRSQTRESVFRKIRQPEWWGGDSDYHPPVSSEPASELEKSLKAGEFVITTEITPPVGTQTDKLLNDLHLVSPYVNGVNFTDSSACRPKMSSLSCCTVAINSGVEPVLQIAARDTTRNGLQSTAMGINAMGVRNILCITGDNASVGLSPVASLNPIDVDSVQMLWILRKIRDERIFLDGRKIKHPPRYFLGAAVSPFSLDPELQVVKDQKKINAGAQFFQTNLIFNPDRLDLWLEQLDRRNILDKVYILVGIAPLKSYKIAEYLHTKVPGVRLPVSILKRMEKAGESAPEEGVQIALELIDSVKRKNGINGIHLMTLGWESVVARIVVESGLKTGHTKFAQ